MGSRRQEAKAVPAGSGISIGFSLLLLFILVGDGTGGAGKREVLTQVNPQDHSALITQSQTCKTSVLLNNTFKLPENAGITGKRQRKALHSKWEQDIENAARQGEQCGGNWFTSRSTLQHRLIMPVATRAALTLLETLPDGAPVFQSTFPGTLNGLTYRDALENTGPWNNCPRAKKCRPSRSPRKMNCPHRPRNTSWQPWNRRPGNWNPSPPCRPSTGKKPPSPSPAPLPSLPATRITMSTPPLLEVSGLSKSFGTLKAVNNASFRIRQGQVVGLIGANGAGKTTVMRMLSTLDMPDSGHIRINGTDVVDYPELVPP